MKKEEIIKVHLSYVGKYKSGLSEHTSVCPVCRKKNTTLVRVDGKELGEGGCVHYIGMQSPSVVTYRKMKRGRKVSTVIQPGLFDKQLGDKGGA